MTTLREAAQRALEALEKVQRDGDAHWPITIDEAITALRAALAQEEQEPVAAVLHRELVEIHSDGTETWKETPLYTHPPRREWQSLSEEEIRAAYGKDLKYRDGDYERFARAIEAALKEKNQ